MISPILTTDDVVKVQDRDESSEGGCPLWEMGEF